MSRTGMISISIFSLLIVLGPGCGGRDDGGEGDELIIDTDKADSSSDLPQCIYQGKAYTEGKKIGPYTCQCAFYSLTYFCDDSDCSSGEDRWTPVDHYEGCNVRGMKFSEGETLGSENPIICACAFK